MPRLALLLWGLYYALALALRVALHRRRTGRSGLFLFRGRPGSALWLGETTEALALACGLAAPLLALGDAVEPLPALDSHLGHAAGVVLFLCGLAGLVISQEAMGASWRIGIDERDAPELVTHGPFALVRHPILASLVAVLAGQALLVPSAVGLAGVALMLVHAQVQARLVEEPHLVRVFGAAYRDYAGRTGRFLPKVGRVHPIG